MNTTKTTRYYHATPYANLDSILTDCAIHKSVDGVVYVCKAAEDALKFAYIRDKKGKFAVLAIDLPVDVEIEETFDHSIEFFQCRCYGIPSDVPVRYINLEDSYVMSFSKDNGGEADERS